MLTARNSAFLISLSLFGAKRKSKHSFAYFANCQKVCLSNVRMPSGFILFILPDSLQPWSGMCATNSKSEFKLQFTDFLMKVKDVVILFKKHKSTFDVFVFLFSEVVPHTFCPQGLPFTWWGCYKPAHSFLFCSCVCFCLYGPFNFISFHKFSRQLSAFLICSSSLISALMVLSTAYFIMKVSLIPDIILCGWLGLKHQLTNYSLLGFFFPFRQNSVRLVRSHSDDPTSMFEVIFF